MPSSILDNIKIVLVNTSHPGNIGAAARAMKNMFLRQLVLVSPLLFPHVKATARASGADHLLGEAKVVETLDEALQDCHFIAGTTARDRGISLPVLGAREAAQQILQQAQSGSVALVFGREDSGLSNQELDKCHLGVRIPANPDYSSLNLAMSVQVLSYELMMAAQVSQAPRPQDDREPATAVAMEAFFTHLEQTLDDIGYIDERKSEKLMRRLRHLFMRANLDQKELNILRGILGQAQEARKN